VFDAPALQHAWQRERPPEPSPAAFTIRGSSQWTTGKLTKSGEAIAHFITVPTLDNLRNFFLTPTTETLSFFQQMRDAKSFVTYFEPRPLASKRLRAQRVTVEFDLYPAP
jgi:hypothetical protein